MLVFIAVLSGVVAGLAAGSLTPLLILRAREQRLGGSESGSVLADETPRARGARKPSEEIVEHWSPPDHAAFIAASPGTGPAEPPTPDLEPPLPDPGRPVPPPSWAQAETLDPGPSTRIWATPAVEEAHTEPEPATPVPGHPPHEPPDERRTEPLGSDLWEGWGSQGTLDELWQAKQARPPVPAALLGAVRRGRDTVVETIRRAARSAKNGLPDRGGSGVDGALNGVRARLQGIPREQLAVAGIVAVAVVAAVVLGILATGPSDEVVHVTVDREAQPSSEPYLIEVDVPATPAPDAEPSTTESETSADTAPVEPAPAEPDPTPVPASGPDVSADASCGTEGIHVDFSLSASEADLQWFTLYVDGEAVSGGPLSGADHSGTYTGSGEPGDHDVELVGTDEGGARSVDRAQVNCPASA